jgi:FkbM family methyltransferase
MSMIRTFLGKVKRKLFVSEPVKQSNLLSLNSRYDLETIEIIKQLPSQANCIDIGAHKGDILLDILKYVPGGKHYAFEPLPHLYKELENKFSRQCTVLPYALSDTNGETSFNYVISNPAYSGIRKREYDRPNEEDTLITVQQRRLDDVIPPDVPVHFIKIDVEGGEYPLLRGTQRIMSSFHPLIIYEQGKGGSDVYGTDPGEFFDFMAKAGYSISLMEYFLYGKESLSREEYVHHFLKKYNFYFIAYAKQ